MAALLAVMFKTFYVSINLYTSCLMAIKMTFLLQYYRVLAIHKYRRIYIAAITIVGCWSLSQILVGIFICTPISGFWDQTVKATCIPNEPQWYANAAGNIVTDIAIFILPLPVLSSLNLARPQKVMLI